MFPFSPWVSGEAFGSWICKGDADGGSAARAPPGVRVEVGGGQPRGWGAAGAGGGHPPAASLRRSGADQPWDGLHAWLAGRAVQASALEYSNASLLRCVRKRSCEPRRPQLTLLACPPLPRAGNGWSRGDRCRWAGAHVLSHRPAPVPPGQARWLCPPCQCWPWRWAAQQVETKGASIL